MVVFSAPSIPTTQSVAILDGSQGDAKILLTTFNPSNDDALFVAVLQLTADILQTCTQDCTVGPPAVPAPATALLLGSGLLGLAVLRKALLAK